MSRIDDLRGEEHDLEEGLYDPPNEGDAAYFREKLAKNIKPIRPERLIRRRSMVAMCGRVTRRTGVRRACSPMKEWLGQRRSAALDNRDDGRHPMAGEWLPCAAHGLVQCEQCVFVETRIGPRKLRVLHAPPEAQPT